MLVQLYNGSGKYNSTFGYSLQPVKAYVQAPVRDLLNDYELLPKLVNVICCVILSNLGVMFNITNLRLCSHKISLVLATHLLASIAIYVATTHSVREEQIQML